MLGAFDGGLKRRGERLRIVDANDKTITDVHYATAAPWPAAVADGSDSIQRIDLHRDVDDPVNWAAAEPSPGKAVDSVTPETFPLSLYQISHIPEAPFPGKPTVVTAWLAPGADNPILQLTLHVKANDERFEKSLMVENEKGVSRQEIRGTIGALPPGTLVRYWFTVRSAAPGSPYHFPSPNEQATAYVVPINDRPLKGSLPIYRLWLENATWQAVQNHKRSDKKRGATFVHDSKAYPVRVRAEGPSRANGQSPREP
ncbi:MAG: hypothetical protein L7V86_11920 [Verrucomicrobiales bacterium]|nr:hypothetical protein [Verrucomicrobiales bacterium]